MPRNGDGGEKYRCGDCGHTETVEAGEIAGDTEERTFGSGRRETTEEVLICPECGSHDWLSESIRELGTVVDKGVADVC